MKLTTPMGGTVWKVNKNEGDTVEQGEVVLILESMKMEIPIEATESGVVEKLFVNEGDFVQESDVVAQLS